MAERQLPLPGSVVKKSNALARATWAVKSIYEPRLVALVAARVHKDDEDFQDYEIPIRELVGNSDKGGKTYHDISKSVENLMSRVVDIPTDSPKKFRKCNVFSYCEYDGDLGVIKCRFDKSLKPHYLGLKGHFAQFGLIEYMSLPSTYSQQVFELLKSWDDKPTVDIPLPELFRILCVPESLKRYQDFKRNVLQKAHKDINKLTSLKYEWEPVKNGRAVVAIRFLFFGKKKQEETKKRVEVEYDKERRSNNELFQLAVACRKSGNCTFKPTSVQCKLCKTLHRSE